MNLHGVVLGSSLGPEQPRNVGSCGVPGRNRLETRGALGVSVRRGVESGVVVQGSTTRKEFAELSLSTRSEVPKGHPVLPHYTGT
eukprot:3827042-Amphidinium_carterae.1